MSLRSAASVASIFTKPDSSDMYAKDAKPLLVTLLIILAVLQLALILPWTKRAIIELLCIVTDLEFFLIFGSWRESWRFILTGSRG